MIETDILECLRRIEAAVSSDEYEDIGVWTVGGGNGMYTVKSPTNTECEFSIYGISNTGACNILVSQNPGGNKLDTTGATSYGTGGGNEGNALEGMFFAVPAAGVPSPVCELYWQPIGRGSAIYVLISGLSAASAFIMIAFRRKLNRQIPMPPRRPPVAHSTRQSARPQRTLQAESPMTAGFTEGRYPLPGGTPYKHVVSPGESHDKSAIERGIAKPLTQAEIALAKLRGKKGVY